MQSTMQQMRQEIFFDPGFVAETPQQLSHTVATLQYPPQVPSYTSRYTGTRVHMMGHSYPPQMQRIIAGHAREGPQIARPRPVYRPPAPGFGAASSLQESSSTPVATGMPHQLQPEMQSVWRDLCSKCSISAHADAVCSL